MRAIFDQQAFPRFEQRFAALTPAHAARWGSMNVHQMVLHVRDATAAVLMQRPFFATKRTSRIAKFVVLSVLPRFPRGVRTPANPAAKKIDDRDFAADVAATVALLRTMAAAPAKAFEPHHPIFGAMSQRDWLRWAYLHTDHHLRQFGG